MGKRGREVIELQSSDSEWNSDQNDMEDLSTEMEEESSEKHGSENDSGARHSATGSTDDEHVGRTRRSCRTESGARRTNSAQARTSL